MRNRSNKTLSRWGTHRLVVKDMDMLNIYRYAYITGETFDFEANASELLEILEKYFFVTDII